MTGWYTERTRDRSGKAVIAVTLLAVLLVAVVPVALVAALVLMLVGHVVGGLALFGGSVLAAVLAVAFAGMTGVRRIRKLLTRGSFNVVPLDLGPYTDLGQYTDVAEPNGSEYADVVQLDRGDYSEVR